MGFVTGNELLTCVCYYLPALNGTQERFLLCNVCQIQKVIYTTTRPKSLDQALKPCSKCRQNRPELPKTHNLALFHWRSEETKKVWITTTEPNNFNWTFIP